MSPTVPSDLPDRPRTTSFAAEPGTAPVPAGDDRGARRRSIVDPVDGTRWTIVERAPAGEHAAGERSLYFVGDGIFRRIRIFPVNWAELSDADLAALGRTR